MTARATFLFLFSLSVGFLVVADSYRPRLVAEKVTDAELIVLGVATLDGLSFPPNQYPVKRSCRIFVLQSLWPTNQSATNTIVVSRYAYTQWPDTWWKYNSQTGIYFFVRTTTALKQAREDMKRRDPKGITMYDDNFFGTNTWMPLERFDDWYEPATNAPAVQRLIEKVKK